MGKNLSKNQQALPERPSPPSPEYQTDSALTPDLFKHPLFLQSEDPILSTIIESLKCIAKPIEDKLGLYTQNKLFNDCVQRIMISGQGDLESHMKLMEDFKRINET